MAADREQEEMPAAQASKAAGGCCPSDCASSNVVLASVAGVLV
jgi:hypothetical protein